METNSPLKIYPKRYSDICDFELWGRREKFIGSQVGSVAELVSRYKNFYKEVNPLVFSFIVKQAWYDNQVVHVRPRNLGKFRRIRRYNNGHIWDQHYGLFMKIAVGSSSQLLTSNFIFGWIASYFEDLFPEFLSFDPDINPEKYAFPYKNITLDHLLFVHQVDNRLELLEEADKRAMSYGEFLNWAGNWVRCYNDEIGDEQYLLVRKNISRPYIKNTRLRKNWLEKKLIFNVK